MAYDHLRLLESSLKFMPAGEQTRIDTWLDSLDAVLPQEVRGVDVAPLAPALTRVLTRRDLGHRLAAIFRSLDERG